MISEEVFNKYKLLSQKLAQESIIALIDDTQTPPELLSRYSIVYCKSSIDGKGGIWYRTLTADKQTVALDAFLLDDKTMQWVISKIEKDLEEENLNFMSHTS